MKITEITRRALALVCAAALMATTLCGCGNSEPLTRDGFYFDTYISISIYEAPDRAAALDAAFELCESYDRLLSRDREGSDIMNINTAAGAVVSVSDATADLIADGLFYSELSGGVFDITCGCLTALWDFNAETPAVPDAEQLAAAVQTVDWRAVELDRENNTVRVPEGVQIDVGGIAKGFIADRIADELRAEGCASAIINLGGNVVAVGDKRGKAFKVGIQSPFAENEYVKTLEVKDSSVVTAGSYQRCFELDGVKYHHILDLETGMPADTGLASVTIVSKASVDGDALATICFLLGEDTAQQLLSVLEESCEAYFVRTDGTVYHYSHEGIEY